MLTERKKRAFKESIELQIMLRDYDPEKEKRFVGTIRLPHVPHPRLKVGQI
jgi:large subunit ribosomal protein L10Ae